MLFHNISSKPFIITDETQLWVVSLQQAASLIAVILACTNVVVGVLLVRHHRQFEDSHAVEAVSRVLSEQDWDTDHILDRQISLINTNILHIISDLWLPYMRFLLASSYIRSYFSRHHSSYIHSTCMFPIQVYPHLVSSSRAVISPNA